MKLIPNEPTLDMLLAMSDAIAFNPFSIDQVYNDDGLGGWAVREYPGLWKEDDRIASKDNAPIVLRTVRFRDAEIEVVRLHMTRVYERLVAAMP